jgi:hypothetical protein
LYWIIIGAVILIEFLVGTGLGQLMKQMDKLGF